LSSAFVCSITPFARDGSLDESAARAHFRRMAECRGCVPVRAMGVEPRHAREMREFAALAARCERVVTLADGRIASDTLAV